MATDIGIELGILLDTARGHKPDASTDNNRIKLQLHVQTVLFFLLGGIVGVVVYQLIGSQLLFAAAAVLFALAFEGIFKKTA
jgi:VIT1/CCC1 family predicted Fe2+/Mn2+ transporter